MATLSPEGLQALLDKVGVDGALPDYTHADAHNSPMDLYRSYLAETLVNITECSPQVAYDSIQWPGDLADLMVVLPRLRLPNSDWNEVAQQLIQQFPVSALFGVPFPDGVHLRLLFSPSTLARILLPYIIDRGSSYGKDLSGGLHRADNNLSDGSPQRIIVEFSSPNLGREFEGTYLRSTVIGAFIAAFHQNMGFEVLKTNFLGDWGNHIGLLLAGWSRFGSEERFQAEPARHLLEVFFSIDQLFKAEQLEVTAGGTGGKQDSGNGLVSILTEKDELFKRMEDGDEAVLELCKRFREVCIAEYAELYARLGITFDEYHGESLVSHDTIAEVEANLKERGVLELSNDAWVIEFAKHESKKMGTGVFRSRNGTTSYLLRDVAGALERSRTEHFDQMLYVVSSKQDSHFLQLFRTLELMGYPELVKKLQHFNFGKVKDLLVRDGSSGILLEDILDHNRKTVEASLRIMKESGLLKDSEHIPLSPESLDNVATLVQGISILSGRRGATLGLPLEEAASMDQNNGLRIYFCLLRLRGKTSNEDDTKDEQFEGIDYSVFETLEEYADVLRLLAQFPGTIKHAFKSLESSTIISFLFRVIDQMDLVWEVEKEEVGEKSRAAVPVAFYRCVELVLTNGLSMLGLHVRSTDRPEVGNFKNEPPGEITKHENTDKLDAPGDINNHEAGNSETDPPNEITQHEGTDKPDTEKSETDPPGNIDKHTDTDKPRTDAPGDVRDHEEMGKPEVGNPGTDPLGGITKHEDLKNHETEPPGDINKHEDRDKLDIGNPETDGTGDTNKHEVMDNPETEAPENSNKHEDMSKPETEPAANISNHEDTGKPEAEPIENINDDEDTGKPDVSRDINNHNEAEKLEMGNSETNQTGDINKDEAADKLVVSDPATDQIGDINKDQVIDKPETDLPGDSNKHDDMDKPDAGSSEPVPLRNVIKHEDTDKPEEVE